MSIQFSQDEDTLTLKANPVDQNGNPVEPQSSSWTAGDGSLIEKVGGGGTLAIFAHATRQALGSVNVVFAPDSGPAITETVIVGAGAPVGGTITKQ